MPMAQYYYTHFLGYNQGLERVSNLLKVTHYYNVLMLPTSFVILYLYNPFYVDLAYSHCPAG